MVIQDGAKKEQEIKMLLIKRMVFSFGTIFHALQGGFKFACMN